MSGRQLRINAPHIVHETIDGETILIHLGTGAYYSLEGLGAHVWGLAVSGSEESEIVADAQSHYDVDPQLVAEAVGSLMRELLDEGLLASGEAIDGDDVNGVIVKSDVGAAPAANPTLQPYAPPSSLPAEFVAPVLSKYTDMQEFMLIDPIHDVEEEAGWPHVKAG
ncbi:MAG: PqqD family protein [Solirubrobacteraceae bacterium]